MQYVRKLAILTLGNLAWQKLVLCHALKNHQTSEKKGKIQRHHRHHYNRNQSPKSKLKAPIQGYDFPWSLAARCQQSMTSMWCGAEDPLRTPWVYRPCQLVPRATTFQPFFCFKPSLFCICLKGLGWFRHLLCKRCRKSLVKGWDIGGVLTCEKWRRWLGTSSTPMCSAYIYTLWLFNIAMENPL